MNETVENEAGSSAYKWVIFGVIFLVMLVMLGINWMVMPVLFTQMTATTGISLAKFQSVWALIPLAGVLVCLPSGLLGDRFGTFWVIGISLIFCTVFGATRGMFDSYVGISIATFLWGGSSYVFMVNYPKVIGQWFPPEQLALMNGLVIAAYSIGAAIGMSISGTIVSEAVGGWQNTYFFWAAISAICTVLWFLLVREKKAAASGKKKSDEQLAAEGAIGSLEIVKKVLSIKDSWYLIGIYSLLMGGWIGLTGVFPGLMEQWGWSRADANNSMAVATLAMILGCVVIPLISDWRRKRRWIFTISLFFCGLSTIGMFYVAQTSGNQLLWIFLMTMGFFAGAMPIVFAIPLELKGIGFALAGTAIGLMNMGSNVTGFLFPMAGVSMLTGNPIWIGALFGVIGFILAGLLAIPLTETGTGRK